MNIEKMREEFEAWLRLKHPTASLRKCEPEDGYVFSVGQYMEIRVQDVWLGWQASRETLVIELPERLSEGWQDGDPMEALADGYWMRSEEVIRAIEGKLVKVRPCSSLT